MAAAFVETAEHLVIFQSENLDADDESLEGTYEQVSGDHSDPVGISALRARKLEHDFHNGRVADCEGADTDE